MVKVSIRMVGKVRISTHIVLANGLRRLDRRHLCADGTACDETWHLRGRDRKMPDTDNNLKRSALDYHEADPPGKIAVVATKPVANQRDLSLAYTPGVAHACTAIAEDPFNARRYTARGNLVGVITNGTAVLGLGDIGPLAAKPVMEGKAVLFKQFAGIDVFDIEVAEKAMTKEQKSKL